ncbi:hypothetical protein SPHINGO361_120517 [Sphingomonas sp. EC-HK361]|nr:hypothetical protein SPHINGO361_120517 [Sphingomonas sp. EC-HK361]
MKDGVRGTAGKIGGQGPLRRSGRASGDGGHDFSGRAMTLVVRTNVDRPEKWWGPVVLEARSSPLSCYPMSSE